MKQIRANFRYLFLAILLATVIFVWYAVFAENRAAVTVTFFDVGEGDAIFIEAPNGNQILIDGGPDKKVLDGLSKAMPFYDRSIDVVVSTHSDADHLSGLIDVLKRYDVGVVLDSGVKADSPVLSEFDRVVEEEGLKKIDVRRGMAVNLGGGAYLKILFPDRDVSGLETNFGCLVAELVYGDTSFMFAGDVPEAIEKYLVFLGGNPPAGGLKSDVLKVGHHGSKTSSSESFIGYTSPEYAVISVGKDNKYGHPNKEVLDTLEKFGIQILRTDLLGSIIMQSDGENIILK